MSARRKLAEAIADAFGENDAVSVAEAICEAFDEAFRAEEPDEVMREDTLEAAELLAEHFNDVADEMETPE